MSKKRDPKNSVTFECEAEGCENQKTIWRSEYNLRDNHYCSNECKFKAMRGQPRESRKMKHKRLVKLKTASEKIAEYFKEQA